MWLRGIGACLPYSEFVYVQFLSKERPCGALFQNSLCETGLHTMIIYSNKDSSGWKLKRHNPQQLCNPQRLNKTFLISIYLMMQFTKKQTKTRKEECKTKHANLETRNTQARLERETILTHACPTSPPGYLRWLFSRVPSRRAKERLHGLTFCV